ncbi:alpha/beta fold hydrolase [Amycolatopsis cihanbeyliensis]|uniref:Pimeloyl-ACP methyl ester carboxylesterase n=1 Tax=Amycolatopsis cihanbeyliensis TaxID=1128664 RepID=A0A542DC51_AMYCI|nr:alpha/beta fold hydrolase [Amycolatopsis cihanbeyliensis]TQJ00649.1 pimeloyl-ACP methyl ester carboxylesterase [Amycolatopsis cihanbeyliensis]
MFVHEQHPDADESLLFLHGGNVAGWMWHDLAASLPDRHSLIPDLPGFGASNAEAWTTVAEVADSAAAVIRARAHDGRAHLVGLSLGAVVGTVLVARHPDLVSSAMLTGAPLRGVGTMTRVLGHAQTRLWGSRAYWRVMAHAFRLPDDSVDTLVETGLGLDRASARRMLTQVYDGVPAADLEGLRRTRTPILMLAGEREPKAVHRALPEVTSRAPKAVARTVPRMRHAWSAEDPELFRRVLQHWLAMREPAPELRKGLS